MNSQALFPRSFLALVAVAAVACGGASRNGANHPLPAGNAVPDGPILEVPAGLLKVQFCTDDVVRVAYAKSPSFFERHTLMTAPMRCDVPAYQTTVAGSVKTMTTSKLGVRVDTATGAVTFLDPAGKTILAEMADGGRTLTPATVNGEQTSNVRQEWASNDDESLYGLGQHQQGLLDIKGNDLELYQHNTEVFVPFLVSSRGYGILWDNTSLTRFGDLTDAVPLPGTSGLYATGGLPGDVASRDGSASFSGDIVPPVTGDYTFKTYSTGAIQLAVNGQVVIDHFRQDWLPNDDIAHVELTAGQPARVQLTWSASPHEKTLRLLWKPPVAKRTTSLWSQVGDGVDYWFVYGPEIDRVIAGYRRLTGTAPMMPKWAYGFWQCRERYRTAQEVLDVLKGYRDRGAPIDNIVQDWQYWMPNQWGSHAFDPERFPDPAGWVRAIHDTYHAHLMISVWPRFYPGTTHFDELNKAGLLFRPNVDEGTKDFLGHPFAIYDAFNPAARQLYWSQIDKSLFSSVHVDAWWLDASEPEIVQGPFDDPAALLTGTQTHMNPTALGSGSRMLNAFPLVNSEAVYEGQRGAAPNQRVFILTRSGFAGTQRYAAATWSGDITSTWTAMRKQIPAGLSFSISGVPYWTLDSGGFVVPSRFASPSAKPADRAEWAELNTRWFEYSTFLPILRVHGQSPPREIWEFGGDKSPAYAAMLKFDKLRYRLLPYLYSLAGMVTQEGYTILRPLVMDFRSDVVAREVADEFMFGPALLVSPVTANLERARPVYLPAGSGWYDFWSGGERTGGQTITSPAPFDAIPVYARKGSIIPVGPELQYASEKDADPITVYVYAGADGQFTLYEDAGTTFDYESGGFATIPLHWDDANKILTIGARRGSFAGMRTKRTFQVLVVGRGRKVGFSFSPTVDKWVSYDGTPVDVALD